MHGSGTTHSIIPHQGYRLRNFSRARYFPYYPRRAPATWASSMKSPLVWTAAAHSRSAWRCGTSRTRSSSRRLWRCCSRPPRPWLCLMKCGSWRAGGWCTRGPWTRYGFLENTWAMGAEYRVLVLLPFCGAKGLRTRYGCLRRYEGLAGCQPFCLLWLKCNRPSTPVLV